MAEGIKKLADPQKVLLALVAEKRRTMRTRANGSSRGSEASPVTANQETG